MSTCCDDCLRRSHLLARLSARIAGLLDRPRPRSAAILALPDDELLSAVAGDRTSAFKRFLERFDPANARAEAARAGLEVVCRHRDGYPRSLLDLTDPPAALFLRGGVDRFAELTRAPVVTIVGARQASAYGTGVARSLGRGLAAAGVPVVSGLALGIDAAVHRGTVDGGGSAIAVLASGPERAYPRLHQPLYRRVLERGVVLSELPPGQRPLRWSFPARNRIMAALGQATVVVEAAEPSGSLITASFATHLNRDVAAVPGRVDARIAAGSNRLLGDGAHVVCGPSDILDLLYGVGAGPRPSMAPAPELDPQLRRVLDAVETGEDPSWLGEEAGGSAQEVRAALGRLEALGLVFRDGFGAYGRCL